MSSQAACRPPASYAQPAATLTATGCVDAKDPTKPAPGLIAYDVASPLWSDGAAKQRFMAIPDGARIHVKDCAREPGTCKPKAEGGTSDDEGHFVFPVGTVLVKNFLFRASIFETRLLMKLSAERWVGYSYRWNAQHSDAELVGEDGTGQPIANDAGAMQRWYFPSRSDCLLCHNAAVGASLGLETRQLDIDFTYPSGVTANQIDTLEGMGLFDAPVKRVAPLPSPSSRVSGGMDDRATLDQRARSYLHANCAICHRPEGPFPGIDLRFGVERKAMGICNVDATKGSAGAQPAAQAKRLVPGHPELSTMYTRMATLDATVRMPQVATSLVDAVGALVIADWIKSIAACP